MTMPGFLSDDELATRADAIFRTGDAVEPAAWQTSAVTDANASAWGAIVSGLTARGYTLEEILMWVEGPAFQGDLGEYFLSLRAKLDVGSWARPTPAGCCRTGRGSPRPGWSACGPRWPTGRRGR
jgi:hypothetical protein